MQRLSRVYMESEVGNQPKHERSRTRWTASLDKIFADLVVKHIQQGNRPNNVFDKKTWNHIRDEFNKQTDLNFNNNQLRKHLDVLRTRFNSLKAAYDQSSNDFTMDDTCCIGFDLWEDIGLQPRSETNKVKDCSIYEQLCAIFMDSSADGKYAQSSHYEELGKSGGRDNADLTTCPESAVLCSGNLSAQVNASSTEKVAKVMSYRKKKRTSEIQSWGQSRNDQEILDTMAKAMLEMVAASKVRTVTAVPKDDKFTITYCIRALDDIEGIDERLYFAALDLFEDPNLREIFISLKSDKIRLTWLQGKCSKTICI